MNRVELISMTKAGEALRKAQAALPPGCIPEVDEYLETYDEIVLFSPGDLVEYENKEGEWVPGVMVAWMVCAPRYICGAGDDRNKVTDPLLACGVKQVRPRTRRVE